tara:strand:- start:535 stop:915 length:381 start_codon:yes stop_codon:yes gene_type:complete
MFPPVSNPQGLPAFQMNMMPRPASKLIAPNPVFEVKETLTAKRATDTEIASPLKQMGITYNSYEVSKACREINDTTKVYMGNLQPMKSFLNAVPTSGMSKLGFTTDRLGMFGMNPKQPPQIQTTFS